MTTILIVLFALSLGICVYIYFGYPATLWLVSRWRQRPVLRESIQPSVTVLIPVFNEETVIGDKIRNTLALDYPENRIEVLVLSDGSTDDTETVAGAFEDPRLRVVRMPRRGKVRTLNEGAGLAAGEILVLTDANSILEKRCLLELVAGFADPSVGGVCGNKKYSTGEAEDATGEGENLYWRLDKWEKQLESSIGSIFAADGALYALRKKLFVAVEDPAQADDIAYSARVVLQGYRLIFEPGAIAWEEAPSEGTLEFRRKVRVTNHSVRALLNLGSALWSSGFYSFELLCHKLIRHLIPVFLLLLLGTNLLLVREHEIFLWPLLGQCLFYVLGLIGFALRHRHLGRLWVFSVPYYFCLANAAALLGILSILRGDRLAVWQPRSGDGAPGGT